MDKCKRAVFWEWARNATVPLALFCAGWGVRQELRGQAADMRITMLEKATESQAYTLQAILAKLTEIQVDIAGVKGRLLK